MGFLRRNEKEGLPELPDFKFRPRCSDCCVACGMVNKVAVDGARDKFVVGKLAELPA